MDKQNFVSLVKELKEALRPHKLLLTSAFGASKKIIDEAYDIRALSKYLDFLHIMCYDYGGAWDRRVTANVKNFLIQGRNIYLKILYNNCIHCFFN